MRVYLRFFFVVLAFGFSGCASYMGQRGTLVRFPGNPWGNQKLGSEDCPNINGKYKDKDLLSRQFLHPGNQNGIQVIVKKFNDIPFRTIVIPRMYMPGQKIITGETVARLDATEFYNQAITSIWQSNAALTIDLMDNAGIIYQKTTLSLDSPMLGCREGAFVIRETFAAGGAEGGLGTAHASERLFRKLQDGSLQVSIHHREWYYSVSRGLIGIEVDNRAGGIAPREIRTILIFPVAN